MYVRAKWTCSILFVTSIDNILRLDLAGPTMEPQKKTIHINPDFLKFSKSKTQRNREKTGEKKPNIPIKMKMTAADSNRTVKRRMMNHLRAQQEENYRKMAAVDAKPTTQTNTKTSSVSPIQAVEDFKSDFDKSLEYLENVAKRASTSSTPPCPKHNPLNKTSRPMSVMNVPSVLHKILDPELAPSLLQQPFQTYEDVNIDLPDVFSEPVFHIQSAQPVMVPSSSSSSSSSSSQPKYGCLKGGTLPTYRTWKNHTQRAYSPNTNIPIANPNPNPNPNPNTGGPKKSLTQRHAEMRAFFKKAEKTDEHRKKNEQAKKYLAKKRQKRIMKRTFRVGKSKVYPRVSVLVSNQTMRNKVQQASANLKNTPIEEVRRFLVKKGLIRIGSTCPNDVLRKMYESTNLLCGELQNHNPDNLLYNYLNQAEL